MRVTLKELFIMRIVFMGTPEFARKSLDRLYSDGHDIAGVFTRADKPRNRGMKLSFTPVKELALEHGSPVYQPVKLSAELFDDIDCELIAVVAYGRILPKEILVLPELGCINIHGSILPKYRGASPIQHAILSGDKETGVTSMYMSEGIDDGDILYTRKTQIGEDETAADLSERLGILGAGLLSDTIAMIGRGEAVRTPQDHNEATFAPLLTKEISPVDWSDSAYEIKCKIRGLIPWPVATMELGGKVLKIFSADITANQTGKAPGTVVSHGRAGLEIACADGTVIVKELQAPGGRRMLAADYLRGNMIV